MDGCDLTASREQVDSDGDEVSQQRHTMEGKRGTCVWLPTYIAQVTVKQLLLSPSPLSLCVCVCSLCSLVPARSGSD